MQAVRQCASCSTIRKRSCSRSRRERNAGKFVRRVHPNLRKRTDLKFVPIDKLEPCDVLFIALPHGVSMGKMACLREKAPIIIDLSADFRLNDPADYPTWYGHEHERPGDAGRLRLRHSRAASRGDPPTAI